MSKRDVKAMLAYQRFLQRAVEKHSVTWGSVQTQHQLISFWYEGAAQEMIIYFSQVILFCIKKKQYCLNVMNKQCLFPYDKYLETKMVSFWNKNKQASALFYTIINYEQVWMSINVLYANISGISVQFLFIVIMKTRGVQNNVAGVTLKN